MDHFLPVVDKNLIKLFSLTSKSDFKVHLPVILTGFIPLHRLLITCTQTDCPTGIGLSYFSRRIQLQAGRGFPGGHAQDVARITVEPDLAEINGLAGGVTAKKKPDAVRGIRIFSLNGRVCGKSNVGVLGASRSLISWPITHSSWH